MKIEHLKDFTNLYAMDKTLRFRLEPHEKTREHIRNAQVIETDARRSKEYQVVKGLIDKYHRWFIDSTLDGIQLKVESTGNDDSLQDFVDAWKSTADNRATRIQSIQGNLRKTIVKAFNGRREFKYLFKKELIRDLLPQFIEKEEHRKKVENFREFTTYFSGFFTNRENMYSHEAKSTGIAFRIINQNLVKFVENISVFQSYILPNLQRQYLSVLYDDFKEYLNVTQIPDLFTLAYFPEVLTQPQIEVYNAVIGGRKDKDNKQIKKGLNQYINEYNQQQKDKSARLPLMKPLFNQILSVREAVSFLPQQFTSAGELVGVLNEAYQNLSVVFGELFDVVSHLADFDSKGIFIKNDMGLNDIAQRYYGSYDVIKRALRAQYECEKPMRHGQKVEKYEEQIAKYLKSVESVSLSQINELLHDSGDIRDYFTAFGASDDGTIQHVNLLARINQAHSQALFVLNDENVTDQVLRDNVMLIKDLLDAIKQLQWFIKPLLGAGDELDKDPQFYGKFEPLYEQLDEIITPLYDKVRSYMTRKPYSLDKFKINFDCSTLLEGWDVNKEQQNLSFLMRKNGNYFLAIMRKGTQRRVQSLILNSEKQGQGYEKMEYKLLQSPVKMLPKCFFSGTGIANFHPSNALIQINEEKSFRENRDHLEQLINFYKVVILQYPGWERFEFSFSPTSSYKNISDFYNEVEQQGYSVKFTNVPEQVIDKLVEEGDLYLFKITNKDFSPHSKGRPNLHTIYWKMLFDPQNLRDVVYKLNGHAEVFFRPKSISSSTVHKAHQAINNKSAYNKANKSTSTFDYDITKDKRFTKDQFELHVPITMNFKQSKTYKIKSDVREFIKAQGVRHIIGIDRGERHLLYLTMIDMDGNIVKQCSLNAPAEDNQRAAEVDYHRLLGDKEAARMQARRDWSAIENIKELKQGYLSQVVHRLATMMIEHDAMLVLENLNAGFMRGRQKVEKSVYQKFEKMLIDKLNYVVDKGKSPSEQAGALHAVQLTDLYAAQSDKGSVRQCGFVFYVPAWNTSKIDPVTGFVNLFDTRLTSMGEIKAFFGKFERISYNKQEGWFEFDCDYSRFTTRAEGCRTRWTICTRGERIWTHRSKNQNNQFVDETVNVTQQMLQLLQDCGIDPNGNLKEAIANIDSKKPLETLLHLFKLTVQMRNSVTGSEVDYMISPVADECGRFFDSRESDGRLPANADANGAFNIARKGLMVARQIMAADDVNKVKFAVSNKDWLRFAQHMDD